MSIESNEEFVQTEIVRRIDTDVGDDSLIIYLTNDYHRAFYLSKGEMNPFFIESFNKTRPIKIRYKHSFSKEPEKMGGIWAFPYEIIDVKFV